MNFSAGLEDSRLSILLDLRHPFAYLALQPAIEFGESEGVEVNWLPLTTPTLKSPSEPRAGDDRGVRHRRFRAAAIAREIETYGAAQGLVLRDYYRSTPVDAANFAWLWVRARHPAKLQVYLTELFRSYWSLGLDASSEKVVASLLDSIAAEGSNYLAWLRDEGPATTTALADELRDFGLFQVPAYVVDAEVFYGRQHLPMIRWILNGRSGSIPI